jgi:hypothetical protein
MQLGDIAGEKKLFVGYSGIIDRENRIVIQAQESLGDWQPVDPLPQVGEAQLFPRLWVTSDGKLHCVWMAVKKTGSRRMYQTYYSHLQPEASGWAEPRLVLEGAFANPVAVIRDLLGRVYLYDWNKPARGKPLRLRLLASSDDGTTWEKLEAPRPETATEGDAFKARLLPLGEGEFLLAWLDRSVGNGSLVVARSADGGKTWDGKVQALNEYQDLSVTGYSLFRQREYIGVVAWTSYRSDDGDRVRIWTDRSGDRGRTWAGNQTLYESRARNVSVVPSRIGDRVGALWIEQTPIGDWLVKEIGAWQGEDAMVDQSPRLAYQAGEDARLVDLAWKPSENGSVAVWAESLGPEPGKLMLYQRGKTRQVSREKAGIDVRGPMLSVGNASELINFLYFEVRRPRFSGDPSPRDASLVFGSTSLVVE